MQEKMTWLRAHCVHAALSVHHDVAKFEIVSGVPFHRIWFGVDAARFAEDSTQRGSDVVSDEHYEYDLGFTGVIRHDQTDNWRARIWKQAWGLLAKRGLRLYSGPPKGVHAGVAHAVSGHHFVSH